MTICVIQRLALTVSDVYSRLVCFQSTSTSSALEVLHIMRYINLRFTYLLTNKSCSNLTYKTQYVCLSVCLLPMAGQMAGPIKTKLGIGTHADPGSVLGKIKVKVKVIWHHLANVNKTPYRSPQGPREFEREAR